MKMSADNVVLKSCNLQVALHPFGYFDTLMAMTCRFFAAMVHLLNKLDDDDICQYYLFIAVDNKSQGRFWRRRKITVN